VRNKAELSYDILVTKDRPLSRHKEAEIANQVFWDDDSPDYSDREYISKNPTYEWT